LSYTVHIHYAKMRNTFLTIWCKFCNFSQFC